MLVDDNAYKLVHISCNSDNVGNSGLGGGFVHCFKCMSDIRLNDCAKVLVASDEERRILSQTTD